MANGAAHLVKRASILEARFPNLIDDFRGHVLRFTSWIPNDRQDSSALDAILYVAISKRCYQPVVEKWLTHLMLLVEAVETSIDLP